MTIKGSSSNQQELPWNAEALHAGSFGLHATRL
jgi:hypothetical protein